MIIKWKTLSRFNVHHISQKGKRRDRKRDGRILQKFLSCYPKKRYLCALIFPGLWVETRR